MNNVDIQFKISSIKHYNNFSRNTQNNSSGLELYNYNRHFSPFRRADITVSASFQRICGGKPQLQPLRLASAAISTRE